MVFDDIQDYIVAGHGEDIKTTLDDLNWDGDAVAIIVLNLNRKVTGGRINIVGELFKEPKEFKATKLFEKADKDLRITDQIEDKMLLLWPAAENIGEQTGEYNTVQQDGPNRFKVTKKDKNVTKMSWETDLTMSRVALNMTRTVNVDDKEQVAQNRFSHFKG